MMGVAVVMWDSVWCDGSSRGRESGVIWVAVVCSVHLV